MARALIRWIVPLGFVPVLLWLTWPLAVSCRDHFPDTVARSGGSGWAGISDMHMSAWALAWDVHALTRSPGRLFDANIFHPAPYALAYSEHFLGHLPVALPVYLATGNPVLTFNLALLASWLGSALAMYALVWRWTGAPLAAFGAGLVFAQAGHELQVVGAAYLPLVPLFLDRWQERRRAVDLVALGVCLVVQTLCSYYQGYAAFLLLGIHAALLAVGGARAGLGAVPGVAAAAALVVAVASIPYLRLSAAGVLPAVDPAAAKLMSAPLRFLVPGAPWFPGWIVVVLAVVGILTRPRRPGVRLLAVVVGTVGVLLAAGPWESVAGVRVPLPYAWLHGVVPGFSAVRFPVRLLVLARFGAAILVGLGLERLGRGVRLATPLRAVAVLALLVARMPGPGDTAVRPAALGTTPSPVYRAIAESPERGAVLELPMSGHNDPRGPYRESAYMLASTVHWKPLINGYSGYAPPSYHLLGAAARRLPEGDAVQELVDMAGLRWVVLHVPRGPARDAWRPLLASGAVRAVLEEDEAILFEVRVAPRRDLAPSVRAAILDRPATTLLGTPLTPLPPGALRASVTFPRLPDPLGRGGPLRVTPVLRNVGDAVWPGLGVWPDGLVVADVGWKDVHGTVIGPPALGVRLPRDVPPGEAAAVTALVAVPRRAGTYRLEVLLRQVDHQAQQSEPASLVVRVGP